MINNYCLPQVPFLVRSLYKYMTLMKGQCSPTHSEVLGKSLNYAELALPFAKKKKKEKKLNQL